MQDRLVLDAGEHRGCRQPGAQGLDAGRRQRVDPPIGDLARLNRYLLAGIVLACIPGYVMLSEVVTSVELERDDLPEEFPATSEEPGTPPNRP